MEGWGERRGDDASGLLPKLSGTEHTHTQNDKTPHQLPFFRRRSGRFVKYLLFSSVSPRERKSATDILVSCSGNRKKTGEQSASNCDCAVKKDKQDVHGMRRPGLTQQSCHRARRKMRRTEVTARSPRFQDWAAAGISITTRERPAKKRLGDYLALKECELLNELAL